MRFSVLDRANAVQGLSESDVLRGVIDHAQYAEKLGFSRFLVAEHHGVPGIPGSQPAVLAAAVAASTTSIRVGTAGIMLPSQHPVVTAEQIGVLEGLFPERIDIGIGSSIGFTAPVRHALRQDDVNATKSRFDTDLEELVSYLTGTAPITVRPQNGARTPIWLLANFRSLFVAANHGLGVIVGGPSVIDRRKPEHEGLSRYRREFRASPFGQQPRVIASINVAVADTQEAARNLLLPQLWAEARARSTGAFDYLEPVQNLDETKLTQREKDRIDDGMKLAIYGTPHQVRTQLNDLLDFTGADEILVTGDTSDYEGRARSEALLADMMD